MKARPRSVERTVAAYLTEISKTIGYGSVERIPVLGRTGPDLTTNELGLVIDVKSRLEVPKSYFGTDPFYIGDKVVISLDKLIGLQEIPAASLVKPSVLVERWYDHMDEWVRENCPDKITALVLHRPKKPIGKAVLVIHFNYLEALKCNLQQ